MQEKNAALSVTIPATVAQVLVDALDLYSRIGMGQLGEIAHLARFGMLKTQCGEAPQIERIEDAKHRLDQATEVLFGFPPGASHGIHSPNVHDSFKTAWALQKAVRHRLAWDRSPQGGLGVQFDEPGPAAQNIRVSSSDDASVLAGLPEGVMVGRKDGEWIVTRQDSDGSQIVILSRSESLQTAVLQAKNRLDNRQGRCFSF